MRLFCFVRSVAQLAHLSAGVRREGKCHNRGQIAIGGLFCGRYQALLFVLGHVAQAGIAVFGFGHLWHGGFGGRGCHSLAATLKAWERGALIETIEASGAQAIIPSRSKRTTQRKTDWHRYKARNLVERFFNRLKQFRRLATRYDKLACRFNAFLLLACVYIWLL